MQSNTIYEEIPNKILVVDDDTSIVYTLIKFLEDAFPTYELIYAPNGSIACQLALSELPSLIIMDWEMPVMNGIEAIKYLKKQESTKNIPVIMATGVKTNDSFLKEALQTGASDFVRKPINQVELMARAQSAIRLSEMYKQEKKLMQSVIEHKNRELSTVVIQVAQKNRVLSDIHQMLTSLPNNEKDLHSVVKVIQSNMNLDKYWKKFKLHFEEVHPDFFTKLQTAYKELSQNELKICAYIKMKLSNKEIAQMLNISAKGMETARYRLKKKLQLTTHNDLNKFIQKFS